MREKEGNCVARNVIRVIQGCDRYGVFWSLENPQSSRLFDLPPLERVADRWHGNTAILDQCMFGLKDPVSEKLYRKRTKFIGSLPGLAGLACICMNEHPHEHVENSVVWAGRSIKRSVLAAVYPDKLCVALSALVRKAQRSARIARVGRVASQLSPV